MPLKPVLMMMNCLLLMMLRQYPYFNYLLFLLTVFILLFLPARFFLVFACKILLHQARKIVSILLLFLLVYRFLCFFLYAFQELLLLARILPVFEFQYLIFFVILALWPPIVLPTPTDVLKICHKFHTS